MMRHRSEGSAMKTRRVRLRPVSAAGLILSVLLAAGTGAAAERQRPGSAAEAPARPLDESAQAAEYAHCMRLAKTRPAAGERFATAWQGRGGGHPAWHCRAVALFDLGRYGEAAKSFDALAQAMAQAPAALHAGVLDQAGQAWLLAGDPVRAYADCGAAAALRPDDPELLVDKAETAAAASYYDKAVEALDRVLQADPNRVDALIYRAAAYRAQHRLDPALADIQRALVAAPNSVPALLERGNIRRLDGDLAGARRDWTRVIRLAPKSAAARAARANLAKLAHPGGPPAP
jgi:tetratricopeptide (TPR) repeat protein